MQSRGCWYGGRWVSCRLPLTQATCCRGTGESCEERRAVCAGRNGAHGSGRLTVTVVPALRAPATSHDPLYLRERARIVARPPAPAVGASAPSPTPLSLTT